MADDAKLLSVEWFNGILDSCSDDKERNNGDNKVKVEFMDKQHRDVIMSSPSNQQMDTCLKCFECWPESGQNDFVKKCLSKMSHHQHSQIDAYLKPILQRDFISYLPSM